MTRCTALVFMAALLATITMAPSEAREDARRTYQELFKMADLVVIANAVGTRDLGKDSSNNEFRVAVLTTFDVIHVVKGKHPDKKLVLSHYRWRNDESSYGYINPPQYVTFDTSGKRDRSKSPRMAYLLFLRKLLNG